MYSSSSPSACPRPCQRRWLTTGQIQIGGSTRRAKNPRTPNISRCVCKCSVLSAHENAPARDRGSNTKHARHKNNITPSTRESDWNRNATPLDPLSRTSHQRNLNNSSSHNTIRHETTDLSRTRPQIPCRSMISNTSLAPMTKPPPHFATREQQKCKNSPTSWSGRAAGRWPPRSKSASSPRP